MALTDKIIAHIDLINKGHDKQISVKVLDQSVSISAGLLPAFSNTLLRSGKSVRYLILKEEFFKRNLLLLIAFDRSALHYRYIWNGGCLRTVIEQIT